MPGRTLPYYESPLRHVRLDTLVQLRWIAVFGQLAAVLVAHDAIKLGQFWACLTVIGGYAALNIFLSWRFRGDQRLEPKPIAWLLAIDIVELGTLLFLTGGLQNPFALLFIGPVLISATALPVRLTLMLAALAVVCSSILMVVHLPSPWPGNEDFDLPLIYMLGVWLANLLAIIYVSMYAWKITEESRKITAALAATELVLEREQHLSQLDGLAAAAAHELGTPLATILVVTRELEREIGPNAPIAEDVHLLRTQALRCRDILSRLSEFPSPGEPYERIPISALVEDAVAPLRGADIEIDVILPSGGGPEPISPRNRAILYGLGNLIENAIDFARERVEISVSWSATAVWIQISDDGPGFPREIMDRLGDPYVTSRRGRRKGSEAPGLGLGFFIAKTFLERSGATLTLQNRTFPLRGAIVRLQWQRSDFERPLAATPAENPDIEPADAP
jgi:two-component system sensor histidine kinase RegB